MGRKQAPILNQNTLKLGIFSANCSGGMAVTKVPERWVNSWENNLRLAKLADSSRGCRQATGNCRSVG
jgi:hypothetical protein